MNNVKRALTWGTMVGIGTMNPVAAGAAFTTSLIRGALFKPRNVSTTRNFPSANANAQSLTGYLGGVSNNMTPAQRRALLYNTEGVGATAAGQTERDRVDATE